MTKKLTKGRLAAVIAASALLAASLALIVVNFFIPVKYLSSYCVSGKRAEIGTMRVSFLDVGYGDCTVIELPDGKNMLIDAGDGQRSRQAKILKSLNERKINVIDYLVCTSVNKEHCGGLTDILKYKTVNKIYMPYCPNTAVTEEYRKFVLAAEASGAEKKINEYGAGEKGEDWFFKILSPSVVSAPNGEYEDFLENPLSSANRNNASAVIWLEYAGTSFLFTGDVEKTLLEKICASYSVAYEDFPVKLENCSVLKVAGHGGENSLYVPFYELIKPEISIISVGENGRACPSQNVITTAANYGKLYRTDEDGTVIIEVTADGYKEIK